MSREAQPGSQEDGFATEDPSRAGQAELAEGGGLFCRAWPSLGAAPPWPAGLSPAPGIARLQPGVEGTRGQQAWPQSLALMPSWPCFGIPCFKRQGHVFSEAIYRGLAPLDQGLAVVRAEGAAWNSDHRK